MRVLGILAGLAGTFLLLFGGGCIWVFVGTGNLARSDLLASDWRGFFALGVVPLAVGIVLFVLGLVLRWKARNWKRASNASDID